MRELINSQIEVLSRAVGLHPLPFECPPVGQTLEELVFNLGLVKVLRPKVIVEIGSGTGGHISLISATLPLNTQHTIVSLDPWHPGTKYQGQLVIYRRCIRFLEAGFGHISYHTIRESSRSAEALREVKAITAKCGWPIDYLFIDGSHEYADVMLDWARYGRLVSRDGVICFHDICGERGVRDAWSTIKAQLPQSYTSTEVRLSGVTLLGKGALSTLGLGYIYKRQRLPEIESYFQNRRRP